MYSIFMYRSLQIQTSRRQCRGERNVIFPTKELLSTQFLELRDWAKKMTRDHTVTLKQIHIV